MRNSSFSSKTTDSARIIRVSLLFSTFACLATLSPEAGDEPNGKAGLLIMAHGGKSKWNSALVEAVRPLDSFCPVEIAFGMAQRDSLQRGVDRLEAQGVNQIAAVRVFISSESFRHQTEYLLGLRPDPPQEFIAHGPHFDGHSPHSRVHFLPANLVPPPVETKATIALNTDGLYDSEHMADVVAQRVLSLSTKSQEESVLILCHGDGDDAINQRWISKLDRVATRIQQMGSFRTVRIETLREDWKDKRKEAQERIREFVRAANVTGTRLIVVPFRLFGFGPYQEVLEGLDYVSNGLGLLPHPAVTSWMKQQALQCLTRIGGDNPFQDATLDLEISSER